MGEHLPIDMLWLDKSFEPARENYTPALECVGHRRIAGL